MGKIIVFRSAKHRRSYYDFENTPNNFFDTFWKLKYECQEVDAKIILCLMETISQELALIRANKGSVA